MILYDTRKPDEIARDALLGALRHLLTHCSKHQREVFAATFPGRLEDLPEASLKTAIGLCQRTFAALNKEERERETRGR